MSRGWKGITICIRGPSKGANQGVTERVQKKVSGSEGGNKQKKKVRTQRGRFGEPLGEIDE